jgi:hypothetical protein
MSAIAAVGLCALLAACGGGGGGAHSTSDAVGGTAPRAPAASNPVDLIHKAGAKTDSTVGEPDLFGARSANGWWEPQDPVTDPATGKMSWGGQIDVTTFPTHDLAVEDLGRRNPSDHTAVLAGDLWVVRLTAGQQAGKPAFVPTPQTVAARLGGKVVQVWP